MSAALSDSVARVQRSAQQSADRVLAEKGRSFHWARHLLSPVHAARATRLYALCRYLDDLADEATSVASANAALASAAHDITRGESADAVMADGLKLMQECAINRVILLQLIDGLRSDLECVQMPDEASLLRYCYQVGGTTGLMMCRVLDIDDAAALPHAVDLGVAMQLTNICRDIGADAALGRRYIPASMVGALAPAALINPAAALQPQLKQCVATLLNDADVYYRSGERGLSYLPLRARAGMLVAARVYGAIGAVLRRHDHAYWAGRAIVNKPQKAVITAAVLLAAPFQRSFWPQSFQHSSQHNPQHNHLHNSQLHQPFLDLVVAATQTSARPGHEP